MVTASSVPVLAQRADVARGVAEARNLGDEAALVHLAERIGSEGVSECLEHAQRAGRLLCAQAARYLERPWPALPVLATVLQDHDRQVSSRAAESMVAVLDRLQSGDIGAQEPLPEEVEELPAGLRGLAGNERLSVDVRAQVVLISGSIARLVGAGLAVTRAALDDTEVAVRRVAVSVLTGSGEAADVAALADAARSDSDLIVVAMATAAVCESTLRVGRPVPDGIEERMRQFLDDRRARPSLARPLLSCLVRAPERTTVALRALASQHPNEATRAVWTELLNPTGSEP